MLGRHKNTIQCYQGSRGQRLSLQSKPFPFQTYKLSEHALLPTHLTGRPLEEQQHLLDIVIVGGGPTGVELAGELTDFVEVRTVLPSAAANIYGPFVFPPPPLAGFCFHSRDKIAEGCNSSVPQICSFFALNTLLQARVLHLIHINLLLYS